MASSSLFGSFVSDETGGNSPVDVKGVVAVLTLGVIPALPSPSDPCTAGLRPSFIRGKEAARRNRATEAARTSAAGLLGLLSIL